MAGQRRRRLRQFRERAAPHVDAAYLRETYGVGDGWDDDRVARWYFANVRDLGLSPSVDFNEDWYLGENGDIKRSIIAGEFYCGFDHFLQFGELEKRRPLPPVVVDGPSRTVTFDLMRARFSPAWYQAEYKTILNNDGWGTRDPFDHYVRLGMRRALSPNGWFDEEWYLGFYEDVREAVDRGEMLCGYEHYMVAGRFEKRAPTFDRRAYLERKLPSVTEPVGLGNLRNLDQKLAPVEVSKDISVSEPNRMNFLVPTLDPTIIFGGYTSMIELIDRFGREGVRRRVLIGEDQKFSLRWARRQGGPGSTLARILDECEVVSIAKREALPSYNGDRFLCYSGWLALRAHEMALHTDFPLFAFLIQEYEPVFHSSNSFRMVLDSAYDLPHIAVFNTEQLATYFRENRLGVFGEANQGEHLVFQHALTPVDHPTAADLRSRPTRRVLCYARPERHAERNLFEVMVLALRRAIRHGGFAGDWTFEGVGSLAAEHRLELSDEHEMVITPKLPLGSYRTMLPKYDVGVSLMYAPHPSIIPFEMARAGLVVVTNTYENRSEEDLIKISPNIEPAPLSVQGIADAMVRASRRAGDVDARVSGANLDWSTSWDTSFDRSFVQRLLKALDFS